ncbi:MAG: hypothetical protein H7A53_04315 [Akkermansiaceae bacterium]|nr:hypothetical protein [Akkermansiaceae bacterium]
MACILLMALIAGMIYGTQQMQSRANSARDSLETAKSGAESAEMARRTAEANLLAMDKKTDDLRQIYREWLPHFAAFHSPQEGESRIGELVRQGGVFLLSQRFELKEQKKDAVIPAVLSADLVFEDDYTKTLNWIGQLEEKVPNCRISKCRLTRGDRGNNLHAELRVELPVLSSKVTESESAEGAGSATEAKPNVAKS